MKRIIFLLSLAFLVSCSNQPSGEKQTADNKEKAARAAEEKPEQGTLQLSVDTEEDGSANINIAQPEDDQDAGQNKEISYLFNKGTTAYSNNDFAAGVGFFEQIVEKDPENRKAFYNLGLGYLKLEKFAPSLQAYTKALAIDAKDSLSLQARGRVYYLMGNYAKCLEDYDRLLQMNTNNSVYWYNRGTAKGALKLYRQARDDFNKAIELNDEYADAFFNRGLAHYFLGMMHEACVDWRKAHALGHYEAQKAISSYCESPE